MSSKLWIQVQFVYWRSDIDNGFALTEEMVVIGGPRCFMIVLDGPMIESNKLRDHDVLLKGTLRTPNIHIQLGTVTDKVWGFFG
jgi:hypothetical protein